MRITRVELTNIKSYTYASIDLRGGVTAIRGHNGAGKTTLLEAIGWALFNYLPYAQKKFVREGANSGKVTVSFISPFDDCEYQVTRRCGAGADWTIFNPQTGYRVESNVDVLDFLKRHMRIEGSIELDDLFVSALGAPQGTLTADFLATPANRKNKFDTLLQVDDYRAAAEKLLPTANLLKERIGQQDVQIAGLERDAALLDDWRQEREAAREAQRETMRNLDILTHTLEQVEALLAQLRQAQTALAQAEGAARVAEATQTSARQRLAQVTALRDESRAAAQVLQETRDDHEAYQRAERERAAAQLRTQERDRLLAEQAQAATERERATSNLSNANARLKEVADAERRILELQAPVAQQMDLEKQRDDAGRNAQRLSDTRKALETASKQRATVERALAERQREATQIETARPLVAALADRRDRVEALQALVATRKQNEQRRGAIGRERAEIATNRTAASAIQARMRENLRKLEEVYRPVAEGLAACESEQQTAEQAVREIEARLVDYRRSRDFSGAGNCPFLREPCKNIQQRGENNLSAYFDRLIAADEQKLIPATTRSAAAAEQTQRARKAAEYYGKRDVYREQLEQAESQLASHDAKEADLTAELRDIEQALAAAGDGAGLAEATRLLRESQEADKRLAALPSVQRALDEQRARLRELTDEATSLEATRAQLASAPSLQQAAEEALARLGDPRAELAGQRKLADARPEAEQRKAQAEAQRRQAEETLARLDESLAPYATLAADILALDAEIARARPGHTRHLQHQRAASQLAERERDHAAATEQEVRATADAQTAAAALAEAQRHFDAQALADAETRVQTLRSQQATLRETQRHTESQLADLDHQITHGEEQLALLERARAERTELTEMRAMLEQFRETIKEAGPLVTQQLLGQISAQANVIFGEIIGDHSAQLAWVGDYEIVLRRDGAERTFALLSGGEQMAAALATRLALLRRLTGLDLAFFDEPTQNMDSERRSALAEQIRRVRGFDQLIVISHDDTFEQGLDSVIHLEKRDGVTVVNDDSASFGGDTPFATGLDDLADVAALSELAERVAERQAADLSALTRE